MQPGDLGLCVRAMSFSTTGSANARVLPDPVLARPINSRPIAEAVQVELDSVLARPIKSRPEADAHASRVVVIELQKTPTCSRPQPVAEAHAGRVGKEKRRLHILA